MSSISRGIPYHLPCERRNTRPGIWFHASAPLRRAECSRWSNAGARCTGSRFLRNRGPRLFRGLRAALGALRARFGAASQRSNARTVARAIAWSGATSGVGGGWVSQPHANCAASIDAGPAGHVRCFADPSKLTRCATGGVCNPAEGAFPLDIPRIGSSHRFLQPPRRSFRVSVTLDANLSCRSLG
jgi:hypothetical protein